MAVSNYGNNVKHLHFYIPGEFLATYQLNKNMIPTSVNEIRGDISDEISSHKLNYSIADKTITFAEPQSNITVSNIIGTPVLQYTTTVQTINLQHLPAGIYLISTPTATTKLKL